MTDEQPGYFKHPVKWDEILSKERILFKDWFLDFEPDDVIDESDVD